MTTTVVTDVLRVSDLLASDVRSATGDKLGHVHEIRVIQDGPLRQGVQATMRVDAILVGAGAIGGRLGYDAGRVRGPWLLRVLFGLARRDVREIPWSDVDAWDDEARVVTLRPGVQPR